VRVFFPPIRWSSSVVCIADLSIDVRNSCNRCFCSSFGNCFGGHDNLSFLLYFNTFIVDFVNYLIRAINVQSICFNHVRNLFPVYAFAYDCMKTTRSRVHRTKNQDVASGPTSAFSSVKLKFTKWEQCTRKKLLFPLCHFCGALNQQGCCKSVVVVVSFANFQEPGSSTQ
jgi:hypothetical protein